MNFGDYLFELYKKQTGAFSETWEYIIYLFGNVGIVFSYLGMFYLLMVMSRQSRYLIGTVLIRCFATFIMFSALSRLIRIVSFAWSQPGLIAILDALCGIFAVAAFILLHFTVKKTKKLPTYKELEERYTKMEEEVIKTREQLTATKAKLEEVIEITKNKK